MFRQRHLFYKVIKYTNWKKTIIMRTFKKSWIRNYKISPKSRYSTLWLQKYYNKNKQFYLSQNKLQCILHYNFSVPSRNISLSRFILSKAADRLILGGFQKS